jgi:hypothetical protein
VLGNVEEPGTSVRRIAAALGIGTPLVWRTLHEQSLHQYYIKQVQTLTPSDHHEWVVFCQWLLSKCVVSTQFIATNLFIDEAGFTRDCTAHNTHFGWMTIPTSLWHQDINIDFSSMSGWAP